MLGLASGCVLASSWDSSSLLCTPALTRAGKKVSVRVRVRVKVRARTSVSVGVRVTVSVRVSIRVCVSILLGFLIVIVYACIDESRQKGQG